MECAVQARRQSLNVQVNDLIFQRAAGAVRLGDDWAVCRIEISRKIVQLAGKATRAKPGRSLYSNMSRLPRGQQLARPLAPVDNFIFLIGFDKVETDMDGVQKALETVHDGQQVRDNVAASRQGSPTC